MRRKLTLWVAWTAAAVFSIVVANQAVGMVRDQVTDRPSPVADAASALAALSSTTSTNVSPQTTVPSTTTSTTQIPETSTTTSTPDLAPSTTSTTSVVTTTTTTSPPTTTQPSAQVVTYDLNGGVVRVRYSGGEATLDSATPKPGYKVEAERRGPPTVEIKFESDHHTSRLKASWEDGKPKVEIQEENEGDD